MGWDWDWAPRLAAFATVMTLVASFVTIIVFRRKGVRKVVIVLLSFSVAICTAFICGWGPYALGRQHVWPPFSPGLNDYYPSSTVAILYNNTRPELMLSLIEYALSSRKPIDLAVDEWLLARPNLRGYVWSPSLVQHMGLQSSISGKEYALELRIDEWKQSNTFRLQYSPLR